MGKKGGWGIFGGGGVRDKCCGCCGERSPLIVKHDVELDFLEARGVTWTERHVRWRWMRQEDYMLWESR